MDFEEFEKKVKSKRHFYEALLFNGLLLPKLHSQFCSCKFLKQVFEGHTWVPQGSQTYIKPVRHPPTAKLLQDIVIHELRSAPSLNSDIAIG